MNSCFWLILSLVFCNGNDRHECLGEFRDERRGCRDERCSCREERRDCREERREERRDCDCGCQGQYIPVNDAGCGRNA